MSSRVALPSRYESRRDADDLRQAVCGRGVAVTSGARLTTTRAGSRPRVAGYASIFGEEANIAGLFRERIAPGAFDRALQERHDVTLNVDHDDARLLARTESGTLKLRADAVGLRIEAELPDTQQGRDLAVLIRRGDIRSMSFAFAVLADEWTFHKSDLDERVITDVRLYDVSAVVRPAYTGTSIGVRRMAPGAAASRSNWKRRLMVERQRGRFLGYSVPARSRSAATAQRDLTAPVRTEPAASPVQHWQARSAVRLPGFATHAPPGRALVSGYAHSWRTSLQRLPDGTRERIVPGAFRCSLADRAHVLLIDHRGDPIAREADGTLALWVDAEGLAYRAWVPIEAWRRVQSGELSAASVSMIPGYDEFVADEYGGFQDIRSADLAEISLVSAAFHEGTSAIASNAARIPAR